MSLAERLCVGVGVGTEKKTSGRLELVQPGNCNQEGMNLDYPQ